MRNLLLLFAIAAPATAAPLLCLWDTDTLAQEEARFPNTIELLTGRFPRHSDAYYLWRIKDREARLAVTPDDVQLIDDLAVAWSKLGKDAKAVELMEAKEKLQPGLYETAANLGTFHIHAGDFAEGAKHIERAIEINPDAHFGREVYQFLLVQYVLKVRGESEASSLPLQSKDVGGFSRTASHGFWSFVKEQRGTVEGGEVAEIASAMKGVLGMMRFGNYNSPILCEALSDLLLADRKTDAKQLAARALLQASYQAKDAAAQAAYRGKASSALDMQTPESGAPRSITLGEVETVFKVELAEAETWWKILEADELKWIASQDNVDERFAEKYYGITERTPAGGWLTPLRRDQIFLGLGATLLALVLARRRYRLAAETVAAA